MVNAIVGAKGDIAKNLLLPLLRRLGSVNLADKDSSANSWKRVWKSDAIWLAIPRNEVGKVIDGIHLTQNQLIVDVCSIKGRVSEQIEPTGATHLSLHPLHGPGLRLNEQKWVVIGAIGRIKNINARKILAFMKKEGISLLPCETEDKHDFMMGITLSMPELMTVVMDWLIAQYSKACGQERPGMKELMEWAVPVSNALFSAYVRAIISSAPWLRRDLLLGSFGDLVGVSLRAFGRMGKMAISDIEKLLDQQKATVEKLPRKDQNRVNSWIDDWFVDSTQELFPRKK